MIADKNFGEFQNTDALSSLVFKINESGFETESFDMKTQ